MEIQGKLIQKNPVQTGQGRNGEWKKQEIILELTDSSSSFPRKLCVDIWGDRINVEALPLNAMLVASVDLESREYGGKWYTNVKAWKIDIAGQGQPAPIYGAPVQPAYGAPVPPAYAAPAPAYTPPPPASSQSFTAPPPAPASDYPAGSDYPPIADAGQPDDLPF